MAERRVELRLSDPGFEEVAKHLDELSLKLDKLIEKFKSISKMDITPKFNLKGIDVADAKIDKINAKLTRLGERSVTAKVNVRTDHTGVRGFGGSLDNVIGKDLRKLAAGGGGGGIIKDAEKAAGGAADAGGGGLISGLLSAGAGANNQYMGALIGSLVALGLVTAPALVPFGLGGLVGGGAAGGAFAIGSKQHQKLLQLAQQLQGVSGHSKAARQQRAAIQQQMAAIRSRSGPELKAFGAFSQLGHTAEGVFNTALTSLSKGFSGGPGGHPGSSFLGGLVEILKSIGPMIKALGPSLGQLFRASIPFIQAFAKIMEKSGKELIPAFTTALKEMTPYIPMMIQGFMILVNQGLVPMLKNLGPGMKDGATIFKASMIVIAAIIRGVGSAATGFAIMIADIGHAINLIAKNAPKGFEEMGHLIAHDFDVMRHDIAHIWDMIWNNTIGRLERGIHDMYALDDQLRHNIATEFDNIRHDIASIWDMIWNNTVTRVKNGINDVINWFKGLPARAMSAINGLGTKLYDFGKNALSDLWNGMKHIFNDVWGWFKSLPGKFLHALGIHSPPQWAVEAGQWIMKGLAKGLTSHKDQLLSMMQGMNGQMQGVLGRYTGPTGGIPGLMKAMAAARGWTGAQWNALYNVEMREAGFNPNARNPGSGAYGLAQFINGPSEYAQYGGNLTVPGQITGMLNYIRQRYGNPSAAWAHEMNYGWYDKGGILKQGLTLALNTTGHDEYIHTGASAGGGAPIIINVSGALDSDQTARQILKVLKRYQTRHRVQLNLA